MRCFELVGQDLSAKSSRLTALRIQEDPERFSASAAVLTCSSTSGGNCTCTSSASRCLRRLPGPRGVKFVGLL